MNKGIKIGIFAAIALFIVILAVFALSKIKVDDFKKAAVIFLVDSSASNQEQLTEQLKSVKQLCSMLDPEDQIKILRVSQDAYLIYEGSPQSSSEIRKSMDEFTKLDSKEYGTAYGLAFKKALGHAEVMHKEGYLSSIVVLGDLENEGDSEKQINWNNLPDDIQKTKDIAPELTIMFLYAKPDKLDFVKEKLSPILGESNLIIGTQATASKTLRKFLGAVGR